MTNHHCVRCAEKLVASIDTEGKVVSVCTNQQCPNFGLLCISMEKMQEFLDREKVQ